MYLEARLNACFAGDSFSARRQALVDAANTSGAILDVTSIEVRDPCLLLIGTIVPETLEGTLNVDDGPVRIHAKGIGTFHTTWGSVVRPAATLGFLVLHRPVQVLSGTVPDDQPMVRVAIEAERCFWSLPCQFIGPICCSYCHGPIPEQRLKAKPGARTCTKCQSAKEKRHAESRE